MQCDALCSAQRIATRCNAMQRANMDDAKGEQAPFSRQGNQQCATRARQRAKRNHAACNVQRA
eukprot:4530-Lingulodinium_polyedra.AAC.1